ncbi:MAG: VIT domain-containing protein, partial [Emcibacteraceae bacterium]|nr:VIT domain-containing protein [Emcibacteraceae bacterium]
MIRRPLLIVALFFISINHTFAALNDRMGGTIEAEVDGKLVYLPQLKSDIVANIEGDLVSVEITQSFANTLSKPMNARYLFPMNKDCAVYEMTMIIDDEITKATIKRKEDAIRIFNNAKREGKTASLLSQKRPNMFTQQIANLMPGQPVIIKIKYTQIVPKIDGNYELVVPLVVGPRYQPAGAGIAPRGRHQIKSTSRSTFGMWELEELPDYPEVTGLTLPNEIDQERVSIKVNINAAMNIDFAASDTHDISVSEGKYSKRVSLKKDRIIDNSDFVLKYGLSGASTQAGFLSTLSEKGEGYFSLLIEPPAMPQESQISNRE